MGPFVRSRDTKEKMMTRLLISLVPIAIFSIYKNGISPFLNNEVNILGLFYPLIFIVISVLFSYIFELIYSLIFEKNNYKEYMEESYNILPGLIFSIILPIKTPIYVLILGTFIMVLIKILFSKFNISIFNPILLSYLLLSFIFLNNSNSIFYNYEMIKSYKGLFEFFVGINGPFLVSSLLCLISFIYLTVTKTIKWRIVVTYILVVFLITYVVGTYLDLPLYYPIFNVLNGGLIFASIYLVADSTTSTTTPIGQIIQGIFLGLITVFLRFMGVYNITLGILIVSIFVPLFDKIGSISRFNLVKSFGIFLIIWILTIALCLYFSLSNKGKSLNFENCDNSVIHENYLL